MWLMERELSTVIKYICCGFLLSSFAFAGTGAVTDSSYRTNLGVVQKIHIEIDNSKQHVKVNDRVIDASMLPPLAGELSSALSVSKTGKSLHCSAGSFEHSLQKNGGKLKKENGCIGKKRFSELERSFKRLESASLFPVSKK